MLAVREASLPLLQSPGWGELDRRKGAEAHPGFEWELMVESPKGPTGREGTHTTAICAR